MKKGFKTIKLVFSLVLAISVITGDMIILLKDDNSKTLIAIADTNQNLKINSITNNSNRYLLKYNKLDNANKYIIEVLDNEEVIYNLESESNDVEIDLPIDKLINAKVYILNINAYINDELLDSIKEEIKWNEPSFNSTNATSINNKTYKLSIDGELSNDYHLVIKDGTKTLYDKELTSNSFTVPTKYYKDKNITLEFLIYNNDTIVSTFTATNEVKTTKKTTTKKSNPIKDINIKNSSYISLKNIQDVTVEYTGGENSTIKNIYIYENNKLIKKEVLTTNSYVITANTFKIDNIYKVVVEASTDKFKKSATINISTIENGAKKMVELARTQIGVKRGLKYSKWYGFNGRVEWCAVFISWLANENGYLKNAIPKFANVGVGWRWFKERGLTHTASKNYTPKTGDIVFFDFDRNGRIDHVGIVDYVDSKYVYTIEGNSNDECKSKKYKINYSGFHGFATPQY